MNDLGKYQQHQKPYRPDYLEDEGNGSDSSISGLFLAMLRKWYIVLVTCLLISAAAVPAVWYFIVPYYETVGAVRVSPIIPNILFEDNESKKALPNYRSFMNTQSELMASNEVLNRVADDLVKRDILSATGEVDPVTALKLMIVNQTIKIDPGKNTELIKTSMKSKDSANAEQIVDSFIRAYMSIQVTDEMRDEGNRLNILEEKQKATTDKMQRQRKVIRQLADEFGSTTLTGRQNMMLEQVMQLQNELTSIETGRIALEAQVQLKKDGNNANLSPANLMRLQHDFINSDLTIKTLTEDIIQLERNVMIDKQTLAAANPKLKQRIELTEALKTRLAQRRAESGQKFHEIMAEQIKRSSEYQLAELEVELERGYEHEKRIREKLETSNAETIAIGRRHLAIQDQQEQLQLTKELYDKINHKIQELEMESKRPARISVAYFASSVIAESKRKKMIMAAIFGALCCGALLALLADKADQRMRTPDDITKCIGTRIIGTTSCIRDIKKNLLPERIADDYRTIRANISMIGENMPHKLVITSSRPEDGKTTLAINLATSIAKSNRKVLLIDGDLRKPDIARILNLPKGSQGLCDVLTGKPFVNAVWYISSAEFDVLAVDSPCHEACDLLTHSNVSQYLDNVCRHYDHVIIDTPPVLAFPDALLWAKMADAVVLTSFAGQTLSPDLKETLIRLEDLNIKVLGTILNSVSEQYGYNRYGYSYYGAQKTKPSRASSLRPLILSSSK